MLLFWKTGTYYEDKKKALFSGDNFSGHVEFYTKIAKGMKDCHWKKLMESVADVCNRFSRPGDLDSKIFDFMGDEESDLGKLVALSDLADLDKDSDFEV